MESAAADGDGVVWATRRSGVLIWEWRNAQLRGRRLRAIFWTTILAISGSGIGGWKVICAKTGLAG